MTTELNNKIVACVDGARALPRAIEKFILLKCNKLNVGEALDGESDNGTAVKLVVKEIDEDTGLTGVVDVYVDYHLEFEVKC